MTKEIAKKFIDFKQNKAKNFEEVKNYIQAMLDNNEITKDEYSFVMQIAENESVFDLYPLNRRTIYYKDKCFETVEQFSNYLKNNS